MKLAPCLALLLLPALAVAVPATTTAPADYSTPKAAALTLADAVIAQNPEAIRKSLVIAEADKPIVNVLLDMQAASSRLQQAVRTKFGPDAVKVVREPGQLETAMIARKALINDADVTITGDTATMTFHDTHTTTTPVSHTLTLTHVGGEWKVDANSLFGLSDPARVQQAKHALPKIKQMTTIMNQTAADTESGKFTSIQEVQNVLVPQMRAVLYGATSQPATAPHRVEK